MFFFLLSLLSLVCARKIIIRPHEELVFYENVKKDEIFKLIYHTKSELKCSFFSPGGEQIFAKISRNGTVYTKAMVDGRVKLCFENKSGHEVPIYYKCPDVNKEVQGHLGYIKDTDLVSDLSKCCKELLAEQSKLIDRTTAQLALVKKTRHWSRILTLFEFILTAGSIYFLHQDFLSIFERKQSL
ncbi:p24 family protein beta-1 [Enteropsectra breve]|nr:p24 family protein beta-1 [Enteropsectra breve]